MRPLALCVAPHFDRRRKPPRHLQSMILRRRPAFIFPMATPPNGTNSHSERHRLPAAPWRASRLSRRRAAAVRLFRVPRSRRRRACPGRIWMALSSAASSSALVPPDASAQEQSPCDVHHPVRSWLQRQCHMLIPGLFVPPIWCSTGRDPATRCAFGRLRPRPFRRVSIATVLVACDHRKRGGAAAEEIEGTAAEAPIAGAGAGQPLELMARCPKSISQGRSGTCGAAPALNAADRCALFTAPAEKDALRDPGRPAKMSAGSVSHSFR